MLALVNRMDKSYKFNKLDEMQNHMSNLITKKNVEKTDDYVVRGKKTKKTPNIFLLQAHQKTKERPH